MTLKVGVDTIGVAKASPDASYSRHGGEARARPSHRAQYSYSYSCSFQFHGPRAPEPHDHEWASRVVAENKKGSVAWSVHSGRCFGEVRSGVALAVALAAELTPIAGFTPPRSLHSGEQCLRARSILSHTDTHSATLAWTLRCAHRQRNASGQYQYEPRAVSTKTPI